MATSVCAAEPRRAPASPPGLPVSRRQGRMVMDTIILMIILMIILTITRTATITRRVMILRMDTTTATNTVLGPAPLGCGRRRR